MNHSGMRHIHIVVRDLERSVRFYEDAFGMEVIHRRPDQVFLRTPGVAEALTLKREDSERVGQNGGVDHFGFPLDDPGQLDRAIEEIVAAGGSLIEKGELEGGIPTAFIEDPDGYRIQI
ncbi:MAG: VOC family protein [Proteobacteria bacterium]|nr:VOC family protein [Pseudomonadota bacterium]